MPVRQHTAATAAAAIVAAFGIAACTASPSPESPESPMMMQPAARVAPDYQRSVDVSVIHGDRHIAIDEVLLVQESNEPERSRLMFFDGDVACEDVMETAIGNPPNLVLAAEIDGNTSRWTFYRGGNATALNLTSEQATFRSGPGGGSLAIVDNLDGLRFEVRGSYSAEVCEGNRGNELPTP